jgi:CheY-like chemotaxis protein
MSIEELIRHDDVSIETVGTGAEALELLRQGGYDCAVLDLRLPDMSGFDLLDRINDFPHLQNLPIVVFTGKELTAGENQRLKKAARSIVIKGVESPERLLDETALFLHRVIADLPPPKQQMVHRLHESDDAIKSKRVLVVDDDVRNIFALSSVLERHGMEVVTAGTGQEAIEKVASDPAIDLVLMDIMMPGMDGYDTMRAIREQPESRSLPIVALTAKAMKGDREKCLEAGASDYLAKPVVTDQLLGMLRQWLHR